MKEDTIKYLSKKGASIETLASIFELDLVEVASILGEKNDGGKSSSFRYRRFINDGDCLDVDRVQSVQKIN